MYQIALKVNYENCFVHVVTLQVRCVNNIYFLDRNEKNILSLDPQVVIQYALGEQVHYHDKNAKAYAQMPVNVHVK